MRKKNNIPGDFLRREIDSTDFKNEKLTIKIRRNKGGRRYFLKNIFENILKQTRPSNKISISKNIGRRNKSHKIPKNCWLSRCKRSRSNKKNYIFLPLKHKTKKIINKLKSKHLKKYWTKK